MLLRKSSINRLLNKYFYSHPGFNPLRNVEGVPGLDQAQHLVVGHPLEGEAAEGDHLVKEDAEAPDVGGGGEEAVCEALGRHPSHR